MIKVLDGTSTRFEQLRPIDFYNPNLREFAIQPAKFAYDVATFLPSIGLDIARALPQLPWKKRSPWPGAVSSTQS